MKIIRLGLSVFALLFLAVGYAGSQVAVLNGAAVEWARKVDQPAVAALSLALIVAALVLTFIREEGS